MNGAQLLVKCLENLGIKRIFAIPGAKVDAIFDALVDSTIEVIVCRHEQNAGFMAASEGRITGKPGVVLTTSGPGVSNLSTCLLTATTERDPVIAISANVPRKMRYKNTHQNADNVGLLRVASKSAVQASAVESIPEIVANAYRESMTHPCGAAFISLPQDITLEETKAQPINQILEIEYGSACIDRINLAAEKINAAKLPVLFLGQGASRPKNATAIRELLKKCKLPTICTYQASGVISEELLDIFVGRVGLFRNQPGDLILRKSDLIICVGFHTIEYDPETWNTEGQHDIIHVGYSPADIHTCYQPSLELLGNIGHTIDNLTPLLKSDPTKHKQALIKREHEGLMKRIQEGSQIDTSPIHPLRFIHELQKHVTDKTHIACDIGSNYMWMARNFISFTPRQLLFSNGQQTLGVAMPWAISLALLFPEKQILSISGDGGFGFSAYELETAVRQKANFTHFVWIDGTYNMVLEQQIMKYKRKSAVDLGNVDIPTFAKAFGAHGLTLNSPGDFDDVFNEAKATPGPVLVAVPIDYSHNMEMFKDIQPNVDH